MRIIHVLDKLGKLGVKRGQIVLGDYDVIGRLTAEKIRKRDNPLFKSAGAFFRPNLERGILIDAIIRSHGLSSMLECGFGHGYSATCAARAFDALGNDGSVTSIDVDFDENHLAQMKREFPMTWLKRMTLMQGNSSEVLAELSAAGKRYDLIYIDGDHTYEGVKRDWEQCKKMAKRFVLFDDYHLPSKDSGPGIQVAKLVDEIDWEAEGYSQPELIRGDRRIFVDDRGIADADIDYGQCLVERMSAL